MLQNCPVCGMRKIRHILKHMKKISNKNKISKKGFTLFIALIVSSLLLAIGFSLGTIILKQLVFANSGKESQLAFYAADSGAECALYWDRKNTEGYTTFDGAFATSSTFEDILCGTGGPTEQLARVGSFFKVVSNDQMSATTTFYADYSDRSGGDTTHMACAMVTVAKNMVDENGALTEKTQIESRGYNVPLNSGALGPGHGDPSIGGGAVCDLSSANRIVERAVRLNY